MDKLSKGGKWAIAGVVIVAIIIIIVLSGGHQGQPPASQATSTTPGATGGTTAVNPAPSPTPAGSNPGSTGGSSHPARPPAIVINLITPVKNDQWKIDTSNPIVWDNEAGVTGEIDLFDAATKNFVGVILSETGVHQTSYSWDTRQVYLLRYSPLKKDIVPGTYFLRFKFDGNNLPNLVSAPFTITQ